MDEANPTTTKRPEGGPLWPVLLVTILVGLALVVLAAHWASQQVISQPAVHQESMVRSLLAPSAPEDRATNTPAVKAYLGIRGKTFHHGEMQGVKILEVFPGSPAARAGLRADHHQSRGIGHIIVGVDGQPIRSEEELGQVLAQKFPGIQIQLFLTNATGRASEVISVTLGAAREAAPPTDGAMLRHLIVFSILLS